MEGNASLHNAAVLGRLDLLKNLIENLKLGVNQRDSKGETPLHYACKSKILDCVKYLVETGADLNAVSSSGMHSLHFAANAGGVGGTNVIIYLVRDKGLDVNIGTIKGATPLHLAASNGNLKLCKVLVDLGADITYRDAGGNSTLHIAALNNHIHILEYFIKDLGEDPDKCRNENGSTALHCACEYGNLNSVKLLLKYGADSSLEDNKERCALSLAISSGRDDIVQYLVEQGGADMNDGSSPLHAAVKSGNQEIIKLLINNGVNVNAVDEKGRSACHFAAELGYTKIVKFLEKHGNDTNKHTKTGKKPERRKR